MTLGGFKFAGKYCERGSLTDTQWVLRMHQTKVSAFMDANTASNASWDYDMSGSPDGNYHCLDTVGNNYVTVFKHTNGENDYTWFALYTITKYTYSGTDTSAVKRWLDRIYPSGTQYYFGYYASSFYRIGTSQINYDDDLSVDTSTVKNITTLIPIGNIGSSSTDISSGYYPPSTSSTLMSASTASFGFAIKNDNIIMFQSDYPGSNPCCSVASGHAFSSIINDNDTKEIFAYNMQDVTNTSSCYESASRFFSTNKLSSPLCCVMKFDGTSVFNAKLASTMLACFSGTVQSFPFQPLCVFDIDNSTSNIKGKGVLSVDLLSINYMNSGSTPSLYSRVASGNYLAVLVVTDGSNIIQYALNQNDSFSSLAAIYVGWDSSNPDITQNSAWTLYSGD